MVEGGNGCFLRIGDKSVDGLLSVDVGLVLKVAAEGVACRLQNKTSNRQSEKQHDKSLTAGQRTNTAIWIT